MTYEAVAEAVFDSIEFYRKRRGGAVPTRIEIGRAEAQALLDGRGGPARVMFFMGIPVVEGKW